jgi:hypothetical protein
MIRADSYTMNVTSSKLTVKALFLWPRFLPDRRRRVHTIQVLAGPVRAKRTTHHSELMEEAVAVVGRKVADTAGESGSLLFRQFVMEKADLPRADDTKLWQSFAGLGWCRKVSDSVPICKRQIGSQQNGPDTFSKSCLGDREPLRSTR